MSQWIQKEITLKPKSRGFHLITDEILNQLSEITSFKIGMCNLFLQHTSASLTVNENADPTVRQDFESFFHAMFLKMNLIIGIHMKVAMISQLTLKAVCLAEVLISQFKTDN